MTLLDGCYGMRFQVGVLNYYGGQEDRSFIRQDVLRRVRKSNRPRADADLEEELEEEDRPLDVLLTTYTMITSKPEDRAFLKKIPISYGSFPLIPSLAQVKLWLLQRCSTRRTC